MAVVVEERPGRGGRRETVPEATGRLAGDPMHGGMKDDPGQFAVPESLIEAFQPLEFLYDRVGHPELAARRVDLQGVGHEPAHALLGKLAFEAPYWCLAEVSVQMAAWYHRS